MSFTANHPSPLSSLFLYSATKMKVNIKRAHIFYFIFYFLTIKMYKLLVVIYNYISAHKEYIMKLIIRATLKLKIQNTLFVYFTNKSYVSLCNNNAACFVSHSQPPLNKNNTSAQAYCNVEVLSGPPLILNWFYMLNV